MSSELTTTEAQNPMALIERMSLDPACDPAKLEKLLSVQEQWQAGEARKEFAAALVEFQTRCPVIEPADKANGRPYARLDRIWRETRALRSELGVALSWEHYSVRDGVAILDGTLWHRGGHEKAVHQEVPLPEGIKGQNAAQRSGSAETYAKRYGTCAVLGIVTGDDDDGNAAGQTEPPRQSVTLITPPQIAVIEGLLAQLADGPGVRSGMLAAYKVAALCDIPAAWFDKTTKRLNDLIVAEADPLPMEESK